MRRKIISAIATIAASTVLMSVPVSAEYYVDTKKTDNAITASVIADNATLSGIEFTVDLPDGAEVIDTKIFNGALYNENNGYYAWAGIEPPKDGTVMFSVSFSVENGNSGGLTIKPAVGYEDDFSKAITIEISSEDTAATEKDDKPAKDKDKTEKKDDKPAKDKDKTEKKDDKPAKADDKVAETDGETANADDTAETDDETTNADDTAEADDETANADNTAETDDETANADDTAETDDETANVNDNTAETDNETAQADDITNSESDEETAIADDEMNSSDDDVDSEIGSSEEEDNKVNTGMVAVLVLLAVALLGAATAVVVKLKKK